MSMLAWSVENIFKGEVEEVGHIGIQWVIITEYG